MMHKKNVLITGCSSGIGLATARALKLKNYRVFATARRIEDVQSLQKEGFESLVLDLDSSHSIQEAVVKVLASTGHRIDVLVINAAYAIPGAIEDLSRDLLRQQFETNVFGSVELINQVIPIMRTQGSGHIVIVSSILGIVTMPYRGAYCASKYALESIADALRMELTGTPISVSLIEPGPIDSKFRQNARATFDRLLKDKRSVHQETYRKLYVEFEGRKKIPFAKTSDDVAKKIVQVIESSSPPLRSYITFPAYLFAILRCLLPGKILDKILNKV